MFTVWAQLQPLFQKASVTTDDATRLHRIALIVGAVGPLLFNSCATLLHELGCFQEVCRDSADYHGAR